MPHLHNIGVIASLILFYKIIHIQKAHAFTKSSPSFLSSPSLNVQSNCSSFTRTHRTRTAYKNKKIRHGVELLPHPSFGDSNDVLNRRRSILGGALIASLLSIPFVAQAYARASGYYTFQITELAKEALELPERGWDAIEDVTIVFHGAGGQDPYTDELMENLSKQSKEGKSYDVMIDWFDYSQKILKASFEGQRVGKIIAQKILEDARSIKNIHVIGISVGAFAADSCVSEIQQLLSEANNSESIYVQLTLLDPFTQKGIIGINYGNTNFGKTADYAQQFMNTDDPVPSTNKPLSRCAVTDVTKIRPSDIFGHDWPLVYYSRSDEIGLVSKLRRFDIGSVRVATK